METFDQRTAQVEIRLELCTSLKGRVTDSSGNPVARAELYGNPDSDFIQRFALTAAGYLALNAAY